MNRRLYHLLGDSLLMAAGILAASIGLKGFLLPNHFLDGGATGISILLNKFSQIDLSILLLLVNLPFLVLAYFVLSRSIFRRSLFTIIALAVVVHIGDFSVWTDDKLLTAIFGGIFLGLGIGMTIRGGAVLDGSEVLALYLNRRFGITIGRVIMSFNLVLFIITAYAAGLEIAMYSILTFIVTAKVTDNVVEGFEEYLGITIVSQKSEELRKTIIEKIGVGVTIYTGKTGGGFAIQQDVNIIHTVINRIDISKLYHAVDLIDDRAFVVEYHVNHVKGGVLRRFLKPKAK